MQLSTAASIHGLILCCVASISCTKSEPGGTAGPGSAASGDPTRPKVAFVSNNVHDFWAIARAGTEKGAQEFNADVEFRMPANGTAAEQRQIIEDLLAKGVQGIAISPKDAANQADFLDKVADQVPLITQDSDLPPGSKRLCYIGTHNYDAGCAAGELIKEATPDGGKIILFVGSLDAQNAVDRRQGLMDTLAGTKGATGPELGKHTLIATMTDESDPPACKANVEDALVKHPDVACFVGLWAYNPPQILSVVMAAKNTQVKIVGFDEDEETLQGVKDGYIHGTIVQQPYEFGYQAVRLLASLARGDKSVLPADGVLPIPHRVIKRDNVEEFHAELKKLKGQ